MLEAAGWLPYQRSNLLPLFSSQLDEAMILSLSSRREQSAFTTQPCIVPSLRTVVLTSCAQATTDHMPPHKWHIELTLPMKFK